MASQSTLCQQHYRANKNSAGQAPTQVISQTIVLYTYVIMFFSGMVTVYKQKSVDTSVSLNHIQQHFLEDISCCIIQIQLMIW